MSPNNGLNINSSQVNVPIDREKVITDTNTLPVLFHEKKQVLLKILIDQEMNIIDLKNITGLNPGTIKRHLTDLLEKELIRIVRTKQNTYGVTMKFYRATAKQFVVNIQWP